MTYTTLHRALAALTFVALCSAGLAVARQKSDPARVLLESGIKALHVDGEPKKAIETFDEVVSKYPDNHAVAAQALLLRGEAQQKLNRDADAQKSYDLIVNKYADQKEAVALAWSRMPSITISAGPSRLNDRTLGEGIRGLASVSADGRFIVFAEKRDLMWRDITTESVRPLRLAQDNETAERPVISRDMKRVAYTTSGGTQVVPNLSDAEKAALADQVEQNPSLALLRSVEALNYRLKIGSLEGGSPPRTLVDNREYNILIPTAWAPGDRSILAFGEKKDFTWEIVWVSVADGSIKTIKSIGWRRISGRPGFPVLSPDGQYIAYPALKDDPGPPGGGGGGFDVGGSNGSKDSNIYVLAADGSTEGVVVDDANVHHSLEWLSNDNLLFLSDRSEGVSLWSVPVRGAKAAPEPVPVKRDLGRVNLLGMTSSGALLYTKPSHDAPSRSVVVVAGLDWGQGPSSNGRPPEAVFDGSNPVWSPDGQQIAEIRSEANAKLGDFLVVRSLRAGDEKGERRYRLAPALSAIGSPLWFHDGKSLLLRMRDLRDPLLLQSGLPPQSLSSAHLYRVDTRNGESSKIEVPLPPGWQFMALSPDDRTIYVVDGPLPDPGFLDALQRSNENVPPEIRQLAQRLADQSPPNIVAIDLSSGRLRKVGPLGNALPRILLIDDKALYLPGCTKIPVSYTDEAIPGCIVAVDLVSGRQRTVFAVGEPDSIRATVASPDGRSFAVVIRDREGGDRLDLIGIDGAGQRTLYGPVKASPADQLGADFLMARLLSFPGGISEPSWTSDSSAILTTVTTFPRFPSAAREKHIVRIAVGRGAPEVIPWPTPQSGVSTVGEVVFSSDVARVAFRGTVSGSGRLELHALENIAAYLKTVR